MTEPEVLLVEDDPRIASVVTRALTASGLARFPRCAPSPSRTAGRSARSRDRDPGAASCTQSRMWPFRTAEPIRSGVPGGVCRPAFSATCSMAGVIRCPSTTTTASAADSSSHSRSHSTVASR